jgi:hypothetical protein
VPVWTRARWIEESFYVLWRQGVDALAWFLITDQPPIPSYATTYQSGLYFRNGAPKPGFEAFRFPFVVERTGRGRAVVWGISPDSGVVSVQRRQGKRWARVFSVLLRSHGLFTRTITLRGHPLLRAKVGRETSLTWRPA